MCSDEQLQAALKLLVGNEVYADGVLQKPVLAQFLWRVRPTNWQSMMWFILLWLAISNRAERTGWKAPFSLTVVLFIAPVFDYVVCVTAPQEVRLQRIMQRDQIFPPESWGMDKCPVASGWCRFAEWFWNQEWWTRRFESADWQTPESGEIGLLLRSNRRIPFFEKREWFLSSNERGRVPSLNGQERFPSSNERGKDFFFEKQEEKVKKITINKEIKRTMETILSNCR